MVITNSVFVSLSSNSNLVASPCIVRVCNKRGRINRACDQHPHPPKNLMAIFVPHQSGADTAKYCGRSLLLQDYGCYWICCSGTGDTRKSGVQGPETGGRPPQRFSQNNRDPLPPPPDTVRPTGTAGQREEPRREKNNMPRNPL